MSNLTNLLSNLNIKQNSALVFENRDSYPENPTVGQLAFINKLLVIYSDAKNPGFPTWCPVVNTDSPTHIHNQVISSLNWDINHNLNSNNLIFFIYDESNNIIFSSDIDFIDLNNIRLQFSESTSGKVVIFSSDVSVGLPVVTSSGSSTVGSYNIETKNVDFTASVNIIYAIDTSTSSVNITLPANPSNGDWVGFLDEKSTFDTNHAVLLYDGTNQIHYAAEGLNLDAPNLNVKFVFNNNNWVLFK